VEDRLVKSKKTAALHRVSQVLKDIGALRQRIAGLLTKKSRLHEQPIANSPSTTPPGSPAIAAASAIVPVLEEITVPTVAELTDARVVLFLNVAKQDSTVDVTASGEDKQPVASDDADDTTQAIEKAISANDTIAVQSGAISSVIDSCTNTEESPVTPEVQTVTKIDEPKAVVSQVTKPETTVAPVDFELHASAALEPHDNGTSQTLELIAEPTQKTKAFVQSELSTPSVAIAKFISKVFKKKSAVASDQLGELVLDVALGGDHR
jgi:hypothetical protein